MRASLGGLLLTLLWCCPSAATAGDTKAPVLPRFTEEREAAALHFAKKHIKELLPALEQLKKSQPAQYEREVREIFQVTEWLADLLEDRTRHDLELSIWVTENRALLLIARLPGLSAEERKRSEAQIQELCKELVDLDIQILTNKVTSLKAEAAETEEELNRLTQNKEKQSAERHAELLKKLRRR